MTTTPLVPPARTAPTELAPPPLASWGRRVVAALLDGAVLGAVAWFVAGDRVAAPSLQPTLEPVDADGLLPWTSSAVVVGAWLLVLVLQGLTGQTPGRRVLGIQVVRAPVDGPVGGPPGVVRSVARWCAHLLDAILLIGYLRPLWHAERRTFADSIVGTLVVHREPSPPGEWRGRAVTVVAGVVVAVGLLAGVEVGSSGGVDRGAERRCDLAAQTAGAEVEVRDVVLVREAEWERGMRWWPWGGDARRSVRERLSLEVGWDVTEAHEGDVLVVETTVAGATVENDVPLAEGWASIPVERAGAGPVEVAVLRDGRTLTSCTATVPPRD